MKVKTTLCEVADLYLPAAAFVAVIVQIRASPEVSVAEVPEPVGCVKVQPSPAFLANVTAPFPAPPFVVMVIDVPLTTEVEAPELLIVKVPCS